MRWKIYYGDGSTFSSEDGPPEAAPGLDVQVIAKADALVGRVLIHGADDVLGGYYWYEHDEWQHGDMFGLFDYLQRPGLKIVKFGRSLTNETYRAIYHRAAYDTALPVKSGRYPNERTA